MKIIKAATACALAFASSYGLAAPAGDQTINILPIEEFPQGKIQLAKQQQFANWRAQTLTKRFEDVTDRFIVKFDNPAVMSGLQGLDTAYQTNSSLSSAQFQAQKVLSVLDQKIGAKLAYVGTNQNGEAIMSIGKELSVAKMKGLALQMIGNGNVASAEPDPRRYPLAENQPFGLAKVQADQVSDDQTGNRTVCIIDSGYDITNPDLANNNHSGTNDSGTGSWSTPGGSHGTHVAGTIAARANDEGVVGIMPNGNVGIHIVKVFNASGWAYSSDLADAVGKCSAAGADVVNMSLGGATSSASERNAMQSYADGGMLLVAAAGNAGNSSNSYPASYDAVVSVAALDESNKRTEFSQYTSQVEISAPGEAILSTVGVGDGRQGYLNYGSTSLGDDRVVPQSRYVPSGSSYVVSNINASASGDLATCSRSGSSYSCGNMSGKICVAERNANQSGSSYPEINAVKACFDAGASGIVVYSNTERPGLQNPFLVDSDTEITVPTISVNRTIGLQLVSAAGTSASIETRGNTDYAYYNGTSMASPHVAGSVALAWSTAPDCTASQVRSAMQSTAVDLESSGRDNNTGFGLIQTSALANELQSTCGDGGSGGGGGNGGSSELQNGVAKTDLSAERGEALDFTMTVPAGATDLSFKMTGGVGDADIYVKFGSEPTLSSYDCRPYDAGNDESCSISNVQAGTYYVKVVGYSTFAYVSLTGSYTEPSSGGGNQGGSGSVSDISADRGQWKQYSMEIPSGMASLTVTISGGSGDADLYVRQGEQPTRTSYQCRPYKSGNEEVCTFNNPDAGAWYFGIRAYRSFSGVKLDVEYQP